MTPAERSPSGARAVREGGRGRPFDVVIVGSGPAGATFARIITDTIPSATVLVVESGPTITSPPGRHVQTIDDPDERRRAQMASQGPVQVEQSEYLDRNISRAEGNQTTPPLVSRPGTWLAGWESDAVAHSGLPAAALSSNVGGMGSHWTCACPTPGPGERVDLIEDDDLDAAFRRARGLLSVTSDAFADEPFINAVQAALAAEFDPRLRPGRRVQPMPLSLQPDGDGRWRFSGVDAILGPLVRGRATGFQLAPNTIARRITMDGDRATGVELHDRIADVSYHVRARAVVAACDALRTPQLLWASDLRLPALGRYLNDHLHVVAPAILDEQVWPGARRASPIPGGSTAGGAVWLPYDRDVFPFSGQVIRLPTPEPMRPPGALTVLFSPKEIRPDDRVTFDAGRRDSFGMPALRITYSLTDVDRRSIDSMVEIAGQATRALGAPVSEVGPLTMPPGSSMHYQGTTRMGAVDDGTSVCGPTGRVWGTENLYVGGNGVIPTATACNPTLTTVAHAVHASRELALALAAQTSGR